MMKKFLAIAFLAALVSCGGSSGESTDLNTTSTTDTSMSEAKNAKDSANKMINQATGKMKNASDKLKDSTR